MDIFHVLYLRSSNCNFPFSGLINLKEITFRERDERLADFCICGKFLKSVG